MRCLNSGDGAVHQYGPCEGLPPLREKLREKLREENGLDGVDVMVTSGANQAFVNVILSVADSSDRVVLFLPYYFNHLMALQMTEGGPSVCFGPSDPNTYLPDLKWLSEVMAPSSTCKPPKAVVIVTPNNPTGAIVSPEMLEQVRGICGKVGAWLIVDNTYENFVNYGGGQSTKAPSAGEIGFVQGSNVVNIFSFSKCYGMMGHRVGYIAYDRDDVELAESLLKVQDTIPICPNQISQHFALGALKAGHPWIRQRVEGLLSNRRNAIEGERELGMP